MRGHSASQRGKMTLPTVSAAPGWAEKLDAIGWALICTGVLTGLAAYFDYPLVAGIVLVIAAVFGGVFLYRSAKARTPPSLTGPCDR